MSASRVTRRSFMSRAVQLGGAALALNVELGTWALHSKAQSRATIRGPRVGYSHPPYLAALNAVVAPRDYASRIGMTFGEQDLLYLESHALATQLLLSRRIDVVAGSTFAHLAAIERGAPLRIFASIHNSHDLVLVARNGITSVDQLFDPKVRLGGDSPGGVAHLALILLLKALGSRRSWRDLPNLVILDSSDVRRTALLNGDVDAAVILSYQYEELTRAMPGRFTLLAALYKDAPGYNMLSFAARADFIDSEFEKVARLTEALITANRDLVDSYPRYLQAVRKYIPGGGPGEDLVRSQWELVRQFPIWDLNGGLEDAVVSRTISLAREASVIGKALEPDKVVDRRAISSALEKIGRVPMGSMRG